MKTMPLAVLYMYSMQHKNFLFPFRSMGIPQEMCTELYCHLLYMCVYVYIYVVYTLNFSPDVYVFYVCFACLYIMYVYIHNLQICWP